MTLYLHQTEYSIFGPISLAESLSVSALYIKFAQRLACLFALPVCAADGGSVCSQIKRCNTYKCILQGYLHIACMCDMMTDTAAASNISSYSWHCNGFSMTCIYLI